MDAPLRSSPISVRLFDAYGTLFDVHSSVNRHAAQLGAVGASVSRLWRLKQLEYTWLRSLMGHTSTSDRSPRLDPDAHPAVDEARGLRPAYDRAVDAYGNRAGTGRVVDTDHVPDAVEALVRIAAGTP